MPVNVSPAFSHDAEHIGVQQLADSLAEFVYTHRNANANDNITLDLPDGYLQIGVFEPWEDKPDGDWRYFRTFSTVRASKELIEACIAEKNRKVATYRANAGASDIWLLLINDLFLGPGEVHARSEDLARWTFTFDFDKVHRAGAQLAEVLRTAFPLTNSQRRCGGICDNERYVAALPRDSASSTASAHPPQIAPRSWIGSA